MTTPQDDTAPKQTALQRWLRIDPQQKPAIYAQIYDTAEISSLNYWLEIVLSAGIAALGLVLNSPAVIIGAMLISPLMGPIMATGLALASGDLYLAIKAIGNLILSISLAVAFSALIVWFLPFHSVTEEILERTNPTFARPRRRSFLWTSRFCGSVPCRRRGRCYHIAGRSNCSSADASAVHHRFWSGKRRKHANHGRCRPAVLDESCRNCGQRVPCIPANGDERARSALGDGTFSEG